MRDSNHSRILRFIVPEIKCSSCKDAIRNLILFDDKIQASAVCVDIIKHEVTVGIHTNDQRSDRDILDRIQTVLSEGGFTLTPAKPLWHYIVKGVAGSVIGLILLILAASGVVIPFIPLAVFSCVMMALTIYLGWEVYRSAFTSLKTFFKTKRLNMDVLFVMSTLTALAVSLASLFVPWLPMMFDAALLILSFRQIGIALEERARRKIVSGLNFLDRLPSRVIKIQNGKRKEINIRDIEPNDLILVKQDEIIPVDGIAEQECQVYQTIYNGNPHPVIVKGGEYLLSGTRVAQGELMVSAKKSVNESYLAITEKYVDEIQQKRAPIEKTTDKILSYFVPFVLGIAAVAGIVLFSLSLPILAIQCIVATLVTACPCTLGFIVPLIMNIGIRKGQEKGITFKGGNAIEMASRIDCLVFDLHGTLTLGKKSCQRIVSLTDAMTQTDILKVIYLLEKNEKHAVACTLYQYAENNLATLFPQSIVTHKVSDYAGVQGWIDGNCYTLGNATWMMNHHIPFQQAMRPMIYLAKNNHVIAEIEVEDALREDARETIQALRQSGKDVYLCTGSDDQTAHYYAKQLGIAEDHVQPNCIPYDQASVLGLNQLSKVTFIHQLKQNGHDVAFIGDGGNDTPAVASAFGIAIAGRSDEKTEDCAHALIQGPLLRPLLHLFYVASKTVRNIKVSLGISLAYNMSGLLLASGILIGVGFVIHPALGALLMVLQVCLMLGIAYYFRKQSYDVLEKKDKSTHASSFWHVLHCIGMNKTVLPLNRNPSRSTTFSRNHDRSQPVCVSNTEVLQPSLRFPMQQ